MGHGEYRSIPDESIKAPDSVYLEQKRDHSHALDMRQIFSLLSRHLTIESFHKGIFDFVNEMGFPLFQVYYHNQAESDCGVSPSSSKVALSRDPNDAVEIFDVFGSMDFQERFDVSVPAYLGDGLLVLSVMSKGLTAHDFQRLTGRYTSSLYSLIDAINVIGALKFPQFVFTQHHFDREGSLKRPMQALQWASQGYSQKQIAVQMHISSKTVNDHLRSARESLDAKNTCHAIRIALEKQLFSLIG